MPSRSLILIRRHINRLKDTISRHMEKYAAIRVLFPEVEKQAEAVNTTWQAYQNAAITGDKERAERDTSIGTLLNGIQQWRPAILGLVPGAEKNIRNLPSGAPTADEIIRVAEDMMVLVNNNEHAAILREEMISDLSEKIEIAKKETEEAVAAYPAEIIARAAFSEACIDANKILIRGTESIRAIFGRTSPEYKQFISRNTSDDKEEDSEAITGEE